LYLCWDHLLPVGHTRRNEPSYIVAACRFCNECCNRTIWEIERAPGELESPEELAAQKKPFVEAVREQYHEFWKVEVGS
jgi:hypothetical protein